MEEAVKEVGQMYAGTMFGLGMRIKFFSRIGNNPAKDEKLIHMIGEFNITFEDDEKEITVFRQSNVLEQFYIHGEENAFIELLWYS